MGNGQAPDITAIKSEVAEIKKVVGELYNSLVILELVIEIVVPPIHIPNICAISNPIEVLVEENLDERKEKKRRKHEEKVDDNKSKAASILDELDQ